MKADLLRHIIDSHGGKMPKTCRTVDAMVKWHQNEHHRFLPNHYHEGEHRPRCPTEGLEDRGRRGAAMTGRNPQPGLTQPGGGGMVCT